MAVNAHPIAQKGIADEKAVLVHVLWALDAELRDHGHIKLEKYRLYDLRKEVYEKVYEEKLVPIMAVIVDPTLQDTGKREGVSFNWEEFYQP